ncbi:MAG: hypothetical protein DRG83_18670, partial [Deltaproteobacteria bacterium]
YYLILQFLSYNYFRYYDPGIGRYLRPDPLASEVSKSQDVLDFMARSNHLHLTDLIKLTTGYGYAGHSPMEQIDLLGLYLSPNQRLVVSLASGIGAAVGGLIVGFTSWGIGAPMGAAIGSSLFGAAAASLLGGDIVDVSNTGIGGFVSGYLGPQIHALFDFVTTTGIQAAFRSGITSGVLEAIMLGADPILKDYKNERTCK